VDICKVDDKANYYYDELTYPQDMPVYVTLHTKGGQATIALTQEDTRGQNIPEPRYATATIIVAEKMHSKQGETYKYISTLTAQNQCDINL
jgi:hypothetical protein